MYNERMRRLLDLKGTLVDQQRAVVETAEERAATSPDDPVAQRMTAEEHDKFNAIESDLVQTIEEIRQLEHAQRLENQLSDVDVRALDAVVSQEQRVSSPPQVSDADRLRQLARGEIRQATFRLDPEQRVQVVGTANLGGDTVPTNFVAELFRFMADRAVIRDTNVRVLTTADGAKLQMPRKTGEGTAVLTDEAVQMTASDMTVDQFELDAYKYARTTFVSTELAADSGVDILGFIAEDLGLSIGTVTGAAYATGTGTNQPDGYVTNATSAFTLAGTEPTADELIDLAYSVIAPYRRNATWLMNDAIALAVRKLKDGNGQYLWQAGLQAGQPDVILGRPVVADPNMPTGTTNKVVLFGDLSKFIIRDVGTVTVSRSDDFRFDEDLISFKVTHRTDSDISDTTGAIKAATAL